MPFQLLNTLLDIDEQMATWRFRHINMVHRMIGLRVGTGGSTGKDYLQAALNKHYIFKEIAELKKLYNAKKIGICSNAGIHPPNGFTPASLNNFICSMAKPC